MKIKNLFVLMTCCMSSICFARNSKEYFIVNLSPSYDVGFFSAFTTVVGALEYCERQKDAGLKVDFEKRGCYFDARYGDNWWQYYFKPIEFGSLKNAHVHTFSDHKKACFSNDTKYLMKRSRAHHLIKKYIHIKPHIRNKIRSFCKKNFKHSTLIGIHYRGTDKIVEAPKVSYEQALSALKKGAKKYGKKPIKVFVATDEEAFLHYLQKHCQYPIVYYDALRSTNTEPVHLSNSGDAYKKGEDALIDCLLLSKCDFLIKMSSNLSDVSLFFNPRLKWMALNKSMQEQHMQEQHYVGRKK